MPFESKRQLQTCYAKQKIAKSKGQPFGWDCDKWLRETPDPRCLPTFKGGPKPVKCRRMKASEKVRGKIHTGPRGGKYFFAGGVKVYIPKV